MDLQCQRLDDGLDFRRQLSNKSEAAVSEDGHMNRSFLRSFLVGLAFCSAGLTGNGAQPEALTDRIKVLTDLAERGDGPSQLKLALVLDETGRSSLAAHWYRAAAEKGYVLAAEQLGFKLFTGNGIKEDRSEAVKWFRMAADQGDAAGQYNLANCYLNGDGVAVDFVKAVQWCRAATEQHYPDAEYMMGVFYGRGDGVTQDYVKAFEWVSRAAEHGHAQAKQSLETLKGMMTPEQISKAKDSLKNSDAVSVHAAQIPKAHPTN